MRKTITHIKSLVLTLLALCALQGMAQTTADKAWFGKDASTITDTSTEFYLYNVGTGKFIIAGGDWGTQACLKYQDIGAKMSFGDTDHTKIVSGVENDNYEGGDLLGVNYPAYTTGNSWGTGMGLIMEAQSNGFHNSTCTSTNGNYTRSMSLTRVEDEDNTDTYTYFLTETVSTASGGTKTFYIGAKNGVDPSTGTADQEVSEDIVAFSESSSYQTADNLYYQWRIITVDQLKEALDAKNYAIFGGLTPNISYMLSDPFFDRNRNNEFAAWTTSSTTTSDNTYRYNWFGSSTTTEVWNKAVANKPTSLGALNTDTYGQYGYCLFEGAGTVSQSITAPGDGTYKVQCRGIYQGNNVPYLYISNGTTTAKVNLVAATSTISKVTTSTSQGGGPGGGNNRTTVSANGTGLINIGQLLFNDDGTYTVAVEIKAEKGNTITIGIGKDGATQSSAIQSGNRSYYYDTDIVAVDNMELYFTGDDNMELVLDEEYTDDSYIKPENLTIYTHVYLYRKFSAGKWNSLVLPIMLTARQVKEIFGENVGLAKLHGLSTNHGTEEGQHQASSHCIDFKTVDLTDGDSKAIEAGVMYLIKPAVAQGPDQITYKDLDSNEKTSYVFDLGYLTENITNVAQPTATYGTSEDQPNGMVQFVGTYKCLAANADDGTVAGSYVFSGGDMYHLSSSLKIKGFRGWLNDVEEQETGTKANISFAIDPKEDETTGIITITPAAAVSGNVYSIGGQLVRKNGSLQGLAKGIYVVNGKKVIVK